MLSIIGFWDTISKLPTFKNIGFQDFLLIWQFVFFYIFILNISQTVTPNLLAVPFSQRIQ